jgi:Spy/CpxP family protein refolding chaperone
MKETCMNRTAYMIVGLTFALTLALAPGALAQQHQKHHPSGALAAQDKPTMTAAEEQEQAPMMQPMRGMMGHGGMMLQQHLEWLSQQLKLSDEQRAQVQALLRNHAKDIIRLRAEIDTMALDVPPLLEANPVDLAKVKQLFQAIAAKEADLRLAHVTAMQDIRKLLNPEQQKQFRTMPGHMMGDGAMMGSGGMMGGGGMMGRGMMRPGGMMGGGGMMGRGPKTQ